MAINMSCDETGCKKSDIQGICRSCGDLFKLCMKHLRDHQNKKHKIVLLSEEELKNMVKLKGAMALQKNFLKRLEEFKNKIIEKTDEIIKTINKASKEMLNYLRDIEKNLVTLKERQSEIEYDLIIKNLYQDYQQNGLCKEDLGSYNVLSNGIDIQDITNIFSYTIFEYIDYINNNNLDNPNYIHSKKVIQKSHDILNEFENFKTSIKVKKQISKYRKRLSAIFTNIGANTRIVVDPSENLYQEGIQKKIDLYKTSLDTTNLNLEVATDIKGIVNQITFDMKDTHLQGRIKALLKILGSLDPESQKSAVFVFCEAFVSRGLEKCSSLEIGAIFSQRYTEFILKIAKSYPQIHEIYFIALISRNYLFCPRITEQNLDEIRKRSEIKDLSISEVLSENDKEKLLSSLDLSRAFGFLIGSLFASSDSRFNEGDIWRYLVYILNLKIEYVDRAYISFLYGFLKCTAGRLRCAYGIQFNKLAELIAGDYVQTLQNKFGSNYFENYIKQLRELMNKFKKRVFN